MPSGNGLVARRERIAAGLVGRSRELDLILAAVAAGRDLLLEGPPGTSKSTILRGITESWGIPLLLVEGNADLTPAKLIGHHNPARVLKEDYSPENFVPGPLVAAMQDGGFLYIEEFNRAPEDTLNVLLTAMAEREVTVPRVGRIPARDSFRLVASMNPFDNVGTTRISVSVYDRLCRLTIGYQTPAQEADIVALRAEEDDRRLIDDAVALTRATRDHPDVRLGSSVRGAIDLVLIARQLQALTGPPPDDPARARLLLDAALLALSGRLHLHETADTTPETIITELWQDHFYLRPHRAPAGPNRLDVSVDNSITLRSDHEPQRGRARLEPLARKPKALDTAPRLYQPDAGGGLLLAGTGGRRSGGEGDGEADPLQQTTTTGEQGEREELAALLEERTVDPDLARMVQQIARRLALRRRPRDRTVGRGRGRITTVPYRYNSDDVDLDATIEVLTERPVPEDTDILVRERMQTRRAIALVGDVSGSMRGRKVRIAAATIAALTGDLSDDEVAVVAFWKNAALLNPIHAAAGPETILNRLLRIPARGLTNVAFGLETGLHELGRAQARSRVGLLLSDAVHNAGPDPRETARRFERLHVLLDVDGEHDAALAEDIARLGNGEVAPIRDYTDVPGALNHLLGG